MNAVVNHRGTEGTEVPQQARRTRRFVVRIDGRPVRFEDRIETVPTDVDATGFEDECAAVKRVLVCRRSLRGVTVVEMPSGREVL